MNAQEQVKLFRMSHQMLESDLDAIEERYRLDLERASQSRDDKDEAFYPQFELVIRQEAATMAAHYELLYCLEKSIRTIVRETLEDRRGAGWWDSVVPETVRHAAQQNMQKERDEAFTPRSAEDIDYTTFGQLGEIVRANWEDFADLFNTRKGFDKVMKSLNVLRGPIAHCCPLAEDEVVRLQITVRDWFRLMG